MNNSSTHSYSPQLRYTPPHIRDGWVQIIRKGKKMNIIGIIGGGLITVFTVLLAILIWQEYKDEKKNRRS